MPRHAPRLAALALSWACLLLPATAAAAGATPPPGLRLACLLLLALLLAPLKALVLKWRLNPSWSRALGAATLGGLASSLTAAPVTLAAFTALAPRPTPQSGGDPGLAALVLAACVLYLLLSWLVEYPIALPLLRAYAPERKRAACAVFWANAAACAFAASLLLPPFLGELLFS